MSDARSRARSLRGRDTKPAAEETAPPEKPQASTKPVRQTVDLTPERHAELAAWRLDTALALGRTRLTTQDVLAAAVDVLLTDGGTTGRKVRVRLEEILAERDRDRPRKAGG